MKNYKFDVSDATRSCVDWIKAWFEKNGKDSKAVVGISGGKDSSVVAALLVAALGRDRVLGVLMPNGEQKDIGDAAKLCEHLGIERVVVNIKAAVDGVKNAVEGISVSAQSTVNLPPRIRMATLYYVSQSVNGRVANTCNLSEDWVGYSTRYGDSVGDFSPVSTFTVTEVKAIGRYLGLPEELVEKTPADGLTDLTDEDNLGFTYAMLDAYIREGVIPPDDKKKRIDDLHEKNLFKLRYMDCFKYEKQACGADSCDRSQLYK